MDITDVASAVAEYGLICRGGFHPRATDEVPRPAGTVILIGNAGPAMWRAFTSRVPDPTRPAEPDPLDAWIRRVLTSVAKRFEAQTLFPFEGPPYYPFLTWAKRAMPIENSPIGPLIDTEFGLWHAYRGALVLRETLALPAYPVVSSPCITYADQPCLATCPVGALGRNRYDVGACVGHLETDAGADCRALGCRARRACPIGQAYRYHPDQAAFHMRAFVAGQRALLTGARPERR